MKNSMFVPHHPMRYSADESLKRSKEFYEMLNKRRSIREFKSDPIPKEILENIVLAAGTAPSGAHKQPWSFCLVSNAELKSKIRELAEKEEWENYNGRMSDQWLEDLEQFETDHVKEFIDVAPYIIIVFKQVYDISNGERRPNYYVNESVGIAVGMLIAAIHNAGLCALTHTPSPMNFLERALDRPENERAFLNIPVGYPAENITVPDLKRKDLDEIMKLYD